MDGRRKRSTPVARVLLVEDNEMNYDMLSRRLRRRGFEVLLAEDGREGIEMALSAKPDLILMDMSLPEIDGWEVTRRLKAMPEARGIPIIALTAHAMRGDYAKAMEAGCDDYDTKPVELSRLLEKMKSLLKPPAVAGDGEPDGEESVPSESGEMTPEGAYE